MTTNTLNHTDRCDRHPAAAALVRVNVAGSDLLFCGHCFNVNADALLDAGATVVEDHR